MNTLEKFFGQALHIKPTAGLALLQQVIAASKGLEDQAAAEPPQPRAQRPKTNCFGDPIAQMEFTDDNIAIIPIHGPLVKGATGFEKYRFGVASHEDISDDIEAALYKGGAAALLFDMSSPGGTVAGTPELADDIAAAADLVPVLVYNGRLSASAAEYITAGASYRVGTGSAINGSIGTILTTVSFQGLLDSLGIDVNVFASGKYKATGHPAKDLTDAQSEFLSKFVTVRADEFKGHMTTYRPGLKAASMEGQIFTGREALSAGLLDDLVHDREEALAELRGMIE